MGTVKTERQWKRGRDGERHSERKRRAERAGERRGALREQGTRPGKTGETDGLCQKIREEEGREKQRKNTKRGSQQEVRGREERERK